MKLRGKIMRIESSYLKQDRLCGQKNNRNAVGNFSDAMNKVRESIKMCIRDRESSYKTSDKRFSSLCSAISGFLE